MKHEKELEKLLQDCKYYRTNEINEGLKQVIEALLELNEKLERLERLDKQRIKTCNLKALTKSLEKDSYFTADFPENKIDGGTDLNSIRQERRKVIREKLEQNEK